MEAHIRVHTDHITQDNMIAYMDTYCSKYYLVQENDATRPHYQAYCQFKPEYQNLESLRGLLRKKLTEKGNKVYSISLARESNLRHIAYLMKEELPPVKAVNISILELKEAQGLVKEFKTKQKMTSMERLAHEYTGDKDVKSICKYIMEEWKRQGKMFPDPRLMKRYVQNIQILKWPLHFQASYIQEVEELFSRY